MPACHTAEELALARALARRLGSVELHVFWSAERPAVAPARGAPLARALARLGRLLARG